MPVIADKSKQLAIHRGVTTPAIVAVAITPSDTDDLATTADALFIGVGGDVTVDMYDTGTNITFKNVASGVVLPITVNRVYSTGTTATNILALRNH